MSRERWGTFSVADHLRPRAFVAVVMRYDLLVIPYPPTPEEYARWTLLNWYPDLPLIAAGATGLVSVAAFAKFDRKPSIDAGDREAAAMIHDIHKNFNWA